jgi:hypothetical protein
MLRLGLCCIFRDQPITAIGRMNRPDALAKLARRCAANAEALLAVDVRPLGSALTSTETRTPVKTQGVDMTAILKTREERREELKRLAAMPNGTDKLYAILTRDFIPFKKLPIGTLMIEAILHHEYAGKRDDIEVPGLQAPQKPVKTCLPTPG